MSASVNSQEPIAGVEGSDALLRTSAVVTSDSDGRLTATLELHGELCPGSSETLRTEIDRLLDDGVADLLIDLRGLRLCTSDGLDIWQDTDERLQHLGGGVRLLGASGVVRDVLDVVADADPTFTPTIEHATPDRT